MRLILPEVLGVGTVFAQGHTRQLAEQSISIEGSIAGYRRGRLEGRLFRAQASDLEVLLLREKRKPPTSVTHVLMTSAEDVGGTIDASAGEWLSHPLKQTADAFSYVVEIRRVLTSWVDAFHWVAEDPVRHLPGLRPPQLGAIHATHAHWSMSDSAATIVMPTGTGKTDAMIALLVSARCERLLVIVPTDALRTQLAGKFLRLGALRAPGSCVLSPTALHPIVTTVHRVPRTRSGVDRIFERSHVIITTSTIAALCSPSLQARIAEHCTHLFIDEAHHAEAPTWKAFKQKFETRRILQFTATPFREDGKPIDGRIIYKYPLRRAQEEGYFKPIRFTPVAQYNPRRVDVSIAEAAVAQLRRDHDKGHILMARVDSIERAREVFGLYQAHTEYNPVQLHSGISLAERNAARQRVVEKVSRIVVCVDMLGEGFDLPELKIAAFHDIRKSLAVTLQLAGRFTRSRTDLGDATFIANVADVDVQEELRKLYTRDPDWNALLPDLSEQAIGDQIEFQQFLSGFSSFPDEIPLKGVRPATSAVVYQTGTTEWQPSQFRAGIPGIATCEQVHHTVNEADRTLVIVTARRAKLPWSDTDTVHNWIWELFVVLWFPEQGLLFINGSSNSGDYRSLARAVCGPDVSLIRGQQVFRVFAGVNRLRLQSVGLSEQLGRNIRFTNRMGSDVDSGLSEAQRRHSQKAVLSGSGFENGARTALGASRRGRVWSFRREPLHRLRAWCSEVGQKLLNASIDPETVLQGTLQTQTIVRRPRAMPIAVDWPEEIYETVEGSWYISVDGVDWPLSEVSIELRDPSPTGTLSFAIAREDQHVDIVLELFEDNGSPNCRFTAARAQNLTIHRGASQGEDLLEFLYGYPPAIMFADGSMLEGNEYIALRSPATAYHRNKIEAWDWTGTDLRRESQGPQRNPATIQARVIRELVASGHYEAIIDDDGSGEIADVVAIRVVRTEGAPSQVDVDLFHCKYSETAAPGRRITDLYEVCGQAQKCVSWLVSPERRTDIFSHLLRRDAARRDAGGPTRFEIGDAELLQTILEVSRTHRVVAKVFIVQPGLSKAAASSEQLELLAVTENYLMETYQLRFQPIGSP